MRRGDGVSFVRIGRREKTRKNAFEIRGKKYGRLKINKNELKKLKRRKTEKAGGFTGA